MFEVPTVKKCVLWIHMDFISAFTGLQVRLKNYMWVAFLCLESQSQ